MKRAPAPPRRVEPELLDHLPADDPEAARSRRDLRRINAAMGNERWILRQARAFHEAAASGIVELGAGEGHLSAALARRFPDAEVRACDLAPPPAWLEGVRWLRGDILAEDGIPRGGMLVANLFLHHFEEPDLARIGRQLDGFRVLLVNEPDRARLPHALGRLLAPALGRVTRHDLHVSIRAGFAAGEISAALGLEDPAWHWRETSTWRGSRRVLAWRA